MKHHTLDPLETYEGQVLATFGTARLVNVNGQIALLGGSMSDRTEALEWGSLFLPDVAVVTASRRR